MDQHEIVQNAKNITVTLDCLILELLPFEIENSIFSDLLVSALLL